MSRFESVGDYASYCRMVESTRLSNGKKKGSGNAKCGNRYLSWAWIEAANFAIRFSPEIAAGSIARRARSRARWRSNPWPTSWHAPATT
ncbi:MAG: transposase [Xanthomonadales bacterium]|nr:transposase [Xanthomonadales bacterium]